MYTRLPLSSVGLSTPFPPPFFLFLYPEKTAYHMLKLDLAPLNRSLRYLSL